MKRVWRVAVGAMALTGAVVLLVGRSPARSTGDADRAPETAAVAALAASAGAPQEAPIRVPAASSSVPAPADARARLMARMKADWCGFGAAEYGRQSDAVVAQASASGNGMVGMEAIEQMRSTPGQEVVDEAVEDLRRRWIKALLLRGDPRSRAVAEFLAGAGEDAAEARTRLQALARTTGDPMVTALALQRPCEAGGCRNIEASQWSRLEPANLQAWLTLLRDAKGGAAQNQAGYGLERMAAEGRYSRTYEREFIQVLLSLPQAQAAGLASEAETQLIVGTSATWASAGYRPLTEVCQAGTAGTLQRCEAVLDRLWEGETLLDRAIALGLARRLVLPAHPGQRARWEPRAREYEAVSTWSSQAPERAGESSAPGEVPCDQHAQMRSFLHGRAEQGEWSQQRAQMRAAGADDAELSAQWRREQGRSSLDPLPLQR